MTATRTIEIEVNGQSHRVTIERDAGADRLRVAWGDRSHLVDVRQIAPRVLSLVELDGGNGSHEVRIIEAARPGEWDVHIDGAVLRTVVDKRRQYWGGNDDAVAGSQEIRASMPGKVVRLLVAEGDEVETGQGVVVVEAMKMENELTAERDGRVKQALVREGASVESGQVLVVLE